MYNSYKYFLLVLGFAVIVEGLNIDKQTSPTYCTTVTKDADYQAQFKIVYPTQSISAGQSEGYQTLICINPPGIQKAVTIVCDWAAPPLVQFTIGDKYVHVVRQDPTGVFRGDAVINTYQLCTHNVPQLGNENLSVTEMGNE